MSSQHNQLLGPSGPSIARTRAHLTWVLFSSNVNIQDPASSRLRQLKLYAIHLEGYVDYLKAAFTEFRRLASLELWNNVPQHVQSRSLFQINLLDLSPRFVVPIQIAVRFFPPVVESTVADVMILDAHGVEWPMKYEYEDPSKSYLFS